jgi:hypothetical protein
LLGPQTRVWSEDEVDAWFETRPVEGRGILRGAVKAVVEAYEARERGESVPHPIKRPRGRPRKNPLPPQQPNIEV